mgnify:FL=1
MHRPPRSGSVGVYTSLAELLALQYPARSFSLLGKQPSGSPLAGRRGTRLRGRGLSFEELRGYQPGDDVSSIDWKVTARTQKPHVRVYTEERERLVLLVVDQRLAMFFGTQQQMKSTTAAELATVIAWQVLAAGDRVGALVFDDADYSSIAPHRSRRTVGRLLDSLIEYNGRLTVDGGLKHSSSQLNQVLEHVVSRAMHDWIVVLISDFQGMNADTQRLIRRIGRRNDVIAALVHDVTAVNLPAHQRFIISDTQLQAEIDMTDATVRTAIQAIHQQRLAYLDHLSAALAIPFLSINTGGDVVGQLRHALGFQPAAGRKN